MGTKHIALLLLIPLMAVPASWTQASAQVLDKEEKQAVVARAGELLTERYIYPDRAEKAKARITQALANGDYETITDPASFAAKLTSDLQSVTLDKHMKVFVLTPNFVPAPVSASPPPRIRTSRRGPTSAPTGNTASTGRCRLTATKSITWPRWLRRTATTPRRVVRTGR